MFESTIQLGEPREVDGIVIAPLFPRRTPAAQYVTLDEAVPLGFTVTEVDAAGAVPELAVDNPLDSAVLLYDGEELLGAKQNRILNVTVLVGAGSKARIPVSCVEQGRWQARSAAFAPAGHAAHPELRRRKNEVLMAAPMARGRAQNTVWSEVRQMAASLNVFSPTAAHADTVDARRHDLDALRREFPAAPGQCGALLALGPDALCLDYVSRPEAWTRLYPKLLDGYLLDALSRRPAATKPKELEAFLGRLGDATTRREPSAGLGDDLRLAGTAVHGSGLELDGELIQLSVFSGETAVYAQQPIARPSRRR
jgi:hypothetical protein